MLRTSTGVLVAALPLPLDLTPLGLTGCKLFVSADHIVPLAVTNGRARWAIPLPGDRALVGARFYTQGLVPDTRANPANAVMSDAGAAVIGASSSRPAGRAGLTGARSRAARRRWS